MRTAGHENGLKKLKVKDEDLEEYKTAYDVSALHQERWAMLTWVIGNDAETEGSIRSGRLRSARGGLGRKGKECTRSRLASISRMTGRCSAGHRSVLRLSLPNSHVVASCHQDCWLDRI